jgi:hypothetical protein
LRRPAPHSVGSQALAPDIDFRPGFDRPPLRLDEANRGRAVDAAGSERRETANGVEHIFELAGVTVELFVEHQRVRHARPPGLDRANFIVEQRGLELVVDEEKSAIPENL